MASATTTLEVSGRPIKISSVDKVMFPEQGWTKFDVVEHFLMCMEGALRGVNDRPCLLKRWNAGVEQRPLGASHIAINPGDRVRMVVDTAKFHFFDPESGQRIGA